MALKRASLIIIVSAAFLSGCGLLEAAMSNPTATPTTAVAFPTATPFNLASTLPPAQTPEPTTDLAPTPLPEPTQLGATADPAATGTQAAPGVNIDIGRGPGITLSEDLGEPGLTIKVTGTGFEPDRNVTLHWATETGPLTAAFATIKADTEGSFVTTVTVPPANQWPGGPANENDFIQLRAKSDFWSDSDYFWANFRYVIRFNPVTSLVLPYTNTDFGYQITLPDGWRWSWEEDDTSNVRFTGVGQGRGFVRVVNTASVNDAIATIMAAEAPGQGYTTGTASYGSYPATQVTAANGLNVVFIAASGRVYALSFVDDAGQFGGAIISSFKLS